MELFQTKASTQRTHEGGGGSDSLLSADERDELDFQIEQLIFSLRSQKTVLKAELERIAIRSSLPKLRTVAKLMLTKRRASIDEHSDSPLPSQKFQPQMAQVEAFATEVDGLDLRMLCPCCRSAMKVTFGQSQAN
jgi:hypothetical protein